MVKIAILGYGNIGSGVWEVINTNPENINKKAGDTISIKYVLDLRDFDNDPVNEVLVHDFNIILNDPEVQIVVETMGGDNPAYSFVKQCLEAGKSVCTSNKELVSKHGPELLEIAKERSVNFLFEASVGGGIPIIRPLNACLTAEEILEIRGIVNGTTNYVLTKMADDGYTYDEALKMAQKLGYAERNPKDDVEGIDACRKLAILSSLAFGFHVDCEDIYTEGITKISDVELKYAKKLDCTIKLLASATQDDNQFFAMVAPFMVAQSHPLYTVKDVFNAIFIKGNMLGDVMFFGSGAGKLPTASAVVSDVIDAAKHLGKNIMSFWSTKKLDLANIDCMKRRFFARISGSAMEREAEIRAEFGDVDVIVLDELGQLADEFGIVTTYMSEKEFKSHVEAIPGVITTVRIEK